MLFWKVLWSTVFTLILTPVFFVAAATRAARTAAGTQYRVEGGQACHACKPLEQPAAADVSLRRGQWDGAVGHRASCDNSCSTGLLRTESSICAHHCVLSIHGSCQGILIDFVC